MTGLREEHAMRIRISLAILLVVAALAACAAPTPTPPTATPVPTRTSAPTQGAPAQEPEATPVPPTPTETMTPTSTATAIISTRTAISTETAIPSQYEKLPTGEYVYTAENGEKITIGKIAGLKQELLACSTGDLIVVYLAEKDNKYGLKEGEYAGEFLSNVVVNNKKEETTTQGGIRLVAPVVQKIMDDTNTPEAIKAGKWQIAFPLDPGNNRQSANKLVIELMKNYPVVRVMDGITSDMKIVDPLGKEFPVRMGYSVNLPAVAFGFSGLSKAGFAPTEYDLFNILVHKTASSLVPANGEYVWGLGKTVGNNITEPIKNPNPAFGTYWLRINVSKNGDWSGFGLKNFIHIGNQIVFLASAQ